MNYLVQCIPQRGFTSRRRSGIEFSAEGTVISAEQMTDAIREDKGLRVIALPDEAVVQGLPAAPAADPFAEDDDEGEPPAQCVYIRANGAQCRHRALRGSEFCRTHTPEEEEDGGGAQVVTLG